MEDDDIMKKIEKQVNKKSPASKKKRNQEKNKVNQYQLWAQLNEETLRKLGYIK